MYKIVRESDLVFGMSRNILNWGVMRSSIGKVSSAYNVFAVSRQINSKYLEFFIKTHSFRFKNLVRPATREGQGVDRSVLMSKTIYLPPDAILAKYYSIEDSLTKAITTTQTEIERLAELRTRFYLASFPAASRVRHRRADCGVIIQTRWNPWHTEADYKNADRDLPARWATARVRAGLGARLRGAVVYGAAPSLLRRVNPDCGSPLAEAVHNLRNIGGATLLQKNIASWIAATA